MEEQKITVFIDKNVSTYLLQVQIGNRDVILTHNKTNESEKFITELQSLIENYGK